MALVLVAFVVPLAILVRVIVADRAVSSATSAAQQLSVEVAAGPTQASLRTSVMQLAVSSNRPVTVFQSSGPAIGSPARRTASVQLAQRTQSSFTVAGPGGREILVAVVGAPGHTAVVRTFVSKAELTHGVTQAWLILAGSGPRAARARRGHRHPAGWHGHPAHLELARVSQRLADGDRTPGPTRLARPRSARWPAA
jgi:hypothetical protein